MDLKYLASVNFVFAHLAFSDICMVTPSYMSETRTLMDLTKWDGC